MQLWEIADEVDSDFALQAVGGDVPWQDKWQWWEGHKESSGRIWCG